MSTTALGFGAPILHTSKICSCGRHYSAIEWNSLPLLGVQHLGGRDRGEMRQCACNSTLLLPLPGRPTVEMPAVEAEILKQTCIAMGGRR